MIARRTQPNKTRILHGYDTYTTRSRYDMSSVLTCVLFLNWGILLDEFVLLVLLFHEVRQKCCGGSKVYKRALKVCLKLYICG